MLTIFPKYLIFDVWQCSEYASGLLKSFCNSSRRDTEERLLYAKLNIVFTPNLEFSHYSEAIHGSATSKLTKRKQSLKKNGQLLNLMFFYLSFSLFQFPTQ